MSNEIQLYSKISQLADPLGAVKVLGEMFSKSGLFGVQKTEQGHILALACIAENKSPFEICRTYHIVEGNISKKALAQLAEFRAAGGKHKWKMSGDEIYEKANEDQRKAVGIFTDREGNAVEYSYSIADAKQENIYRSGSRWTKRPGNMLRARCVTNALGMLMPEIVAGESDGDDTVIVPTLNLTPEKPAVEIVVEKVFDKSKVPVENAAAVNADAKKPDDEKELSSMGLAPEQKPTGHYEQAVGRGTRDNSVMEFTPELMPDGKLSTATVEAICKKLGGENMKLMPQVTEKMILKTWIEKDGDLSKLSLARANQIGRHTAQAFYAQFGITA